ERNVASSEMPATIEETPAVGNLDVLVWVRDHSPSNLSGYIGCGHWQAQLAANQPNSFLLKRTQSSQSSTPGPALGDAACAEWTNGCQICKRQPDEKFACSNIAIACQPQTMRCVR